MTSGKENKSGGLMTIFIPLEKLILIHNESQLQGQITDRIVSKCPNLQCYITIKKGQLNIWKYN